MLFPSCYSQKDELDNSTIELSKVQSVKVVAKKRRDRGLPRAFEIFTDSKTYVLKAQDEKHAEEWLQCINVAVAQAKERENREATTYLWCLFCWGSCGLIKPDGCVLFPGFFFFSLWHFINIRDKRPVSNATFNLCSHPPHKFLQWQAIKTVSWSFVTVSLAKGIKGTLWSKRIPQENPNESWSIGHPTVLWTSQTCVRKEHKTTSQYQVRHLGHDQRKWVTYNEAE